LPLPALMVSGLEEPMITSSPDVPLMVPEPLMTLAPGILAASWQSFS